MVDPKIFEQLNALNESVRDEEERMFGGAMGSMGAAGSSPPVDLSRSQNFQEIVRLLHARPILVEPTLLYLRKTEQRLAQAELAVLYTEEELAELYRRSGLVPPGGEGGADAQPAVQATEPQTTEQQQTSEQPQAAE